MKQVQANYFITFFQSIEVIILGPRNCYPQRWWVWLLQQFFENKNRLQVTVHTVWFQIHCLC